MASKNSSFFRVHLASMRSSDLGAAAGTRQLRPKPGPGHGPFAVDGSIGDSQNLCDLLNRVAAEIAQFDDPRLLRVQLGKPRQRLVYGERLVRAFARVVEHLSELHTIARLRAPFGVGGTRVIDEDAAERRSRHGVEMGATLPID